MKKYMVYKCSKYSIGIYLFGDPLEISKRYIEEKLSYVYHKINLFL